jgi:hypothetical protein
MSDGVVIDFEFRLVAIAYAHEQPFHPRRPPRSTPPLAVPPKR